LEVAYLFYRIKKKKNGKKKMAKRKGTEWKKIAVRREGRKKKEVRLTHGFFDPWFFPWG